MQSRVHCRDLCRSRGHSHCAHPCLVGPWAAWSGLFPFLLLHLFVRINKYKYTISTHHCPWKLGLLEVFLLKQLLAGKLGFD